MGTLHFRWVFPKVGVHQTHPTMTLVVGIPDKVSLKFQRAPIGSTISMRASTMVQAWITSLMAADGILRPLVSCEWRNGKENGNYHDGLYRDYYEDPFLHSLLTKGQLTGLLGSQNSHQSGSCLLPNCSYMSTFVCIYTTSKLYSGFTGFEFYLEFRFGTA